MILAGHQPNYLPWPGFFYKMMYADRFILADSFQYSKHSYYNRGKIRRSENSIWLSVPVSGNRSRINEVKIAQDNNWRRKHWQALRHAYKDAPYFDHYADFFSAIYQKEWRYLFDLSFTLIMDICGFLQINTSILLASDLNMNTTDINAMMHRTSCNRYLTETEYIPISSIDAENKLMIYQPYPDISIIDALFHYGPETKHKLNFQQKPQSLS
jgi:hypothetical protein